MAQYSFGETVKTRRERLGLTQDDLARALDTHQSTVTRWEQRTYPLRDKRLLERLASVLRVSVDSLLGLDRESGIAEEQPWYTTSAAWSRVWELVEGLPEGEREAIRRLIEASAQNMSEDALDALTASVRALADKKRRRAGHDEGTMDDSSGSVVYLPEVNKSARKEG